MLKFALFSKNLREFGREIMKKWLFVALCAAFLACKDEGVGFELENRAFEIVSIEANGVNIATQGFADEKPRIEFSANAYNGTSGCNSFFGSFVANADTIEFSDNGGATKMLCPPDIMHFEDALLSNLRGKFTLGEENGLLILSSKKAKIYLKNSLK